MQTLPRSAQIYLLVLWGVAAIQAGFVLSTARPPIDQILLFPIWLLIFVLADYFEVEFEIDDGNRIATTVYEAVIVFLAGVSGLYALTPIIIGSLVADTLHRRPWYRSLFNAAERALTYSCMVFVFQLFNQGVLPFSGAFGLVSLLATAGTYYIVNTLLVATVIALSSQLPLLQVIRSSFLKVHWIHFLTLPIGAILAALWFVDRWLAVAGVIPLIMAHRSFKAISAWQSESRQKAMLARQAQSLAIQLERLQDITTAMVTSLDPKIVLETMSVRLAQLLNAQASWVVLLDSSPPELVAAHGVLPCWAKTIETYKPAIQPQDVQLLDSAQLAALGLIHKGEPAMQTFAAIPLTLEERMLGCICLIFEQPMTLDNTNKRVLRAFATQVALVMEHAYLFDALQHKQNELVRSSKLAALGTFSAGIAHEFNNILAGILGYAQLGKTSDSPEEQREALGIIEQSCVRARGITAGLLAFARMRAPQRKLNLVRDAIESALLLIERELVKMNITLERHLMSVPPTVCDNDQITQVVLNLLTNARDAMRDQGGGTIAIYLEQYQDQIEIRVSDTGCGIAPDLLDQIFQPFMTTKTSLSSSTTSGTGLGLAISQGIIESHHGTISIASTLGVGTTLTIRLPIVDDIEEPEQPQTVQEPAAGMRILIVDDDQQVVAALGQLLAQQGHKPVLAQNGLAALDHYQAQPFDLVLSDVVMPGVDGVALLARLQKIDPHVRVLAMTGQSGTLQTEKMLRAGALGILIKPFTVEELLAAIAKHIPSYALDR